MAEELHSYFCICGREMGIPPFYCGKLLSCPYCRSFVTVPFEEKGLAIQPSLNLTTPRLKIYPAQRRHWRAWYEIHSDPRNYDFEVSDPPSIVESKRQVKASLFPRGFEKSHRLIFMVFNDAGFAVGSVSVTFTQPYLMAVLGLVFHFEHQGTGYGKEAVKRICDFLMQKWKVEKISAMCDSKNVACRGVLERVGFRSEGMMRKYFYHPKRGWLDSPVYALFRED